MSPGYPSNKSLDFRTRGTKPQRFVQLEQLDAKAENLTFLLNSTRKSGTSVMQGFVTPNRQFIFQAPRRPVFLLCGNKVRLHTKFRVARKPGRRV